jgi:hypothetical protein
VSSELFEAARAVRSYLDELVPDRAAPLDAQVVALLAQANTDPAGAAAGLAEIFSADPDLQDWIAALLADPDLRPPDVAEADNPAATKSFPPLAGDQQPITATRYACPSGDRVVWYRRSAGQSPPACPTHGVELVPQPRQPQ